MLCRPLLSHRSTTATAVEDTKDDESRCWEKDAEWSFRCVDRRSSGTGVVRSGGRGQAGDRSEQRLEIPTVRCLLKGPPAWIEVSTSDHLRDR